MPDTPSPPPTRGDRTPRPTAPPARPLRLPSWRATAILAASMLALGVAVGAAIGPSPGTSSASSGSIVGSVVVPYLNELERAQLAGAAAPAQAPSTPAPARRHRRRRHRKGAGATATTVTTTTTTSTSTSTSGAKSTLPAITDVWLIELAGGTFAEALAQQSAAPQIDGTIIPSGVLLSSWSALDGSAFAGEAALLTAQGSAAGATPPTLQTITQPLCPEGAAGASCTPGTAAGLTTADTFLAQTLSVIKANPAYGAHGLIVVTFGTLAAGSATGLPAGSQAGTLTSAPPAGVLLISPFAHAGTRPSTAFNPTSPRQSLEQLLQR